MRTRLAVGVSHDLGLRNRGYSAALLPHTFGAAPHPAFPEGEQDLIHLPSLTDNLAGNDQWTGCWPQFQADHGLALSRLEPVRRVAGRTGQPASGAELQLLSWPLPSTRTAPQHEPPPFTGRARRAKALLPTLFLGLRRCAGSCQAVDPGRLALGFRRVVAHGAPAGSRLVGTVMVTGLPVRGSKMVIGMAVSTGPTRAPLRRSE